jgi:hypothetical protein
MQSSNIFGVQAAARDPSGAAPVPGPRLRAHCRKTSWQQKYQGKAAKQLFPLLKNCYRRLDERRLQKHPNCRDGMESGGFLCIFFAHVADYVTYLVPSLHTVRIVFRSPYSLYF